jgi:hypothetical protein
MPQPIGEYRSRKLQEIKHDTLAVGEDGSEWEYASGKNASAAMTWKRRTGMSVDGRSMVLPIIFLVLGIEFDVAGANHWWMVMAGGMFTACFVIAVWRRIDSVCKGRRPK